MLSVWGYARAERVGFCGDEGEMSEEMRARGMDECLTCEVKADQYRKFYVLSSKTTLSFNFLKNLLKKFAFRIALNNGGVKKCCKLKSHSQTFIQLQHYVLT